MLKSEAFKHHQFAMKAAVLNCQ